jgi:hypothetical protein
MAECNFSIEFQGPATDIVAKMKSEIQKQGGTFNGDDAAGSFSVKVLGSTIAGSYTIAGSQINITIDSKPFFVSCSQIESFLKSYINS